MPGKGMFDAEVREPRQNKVGLKNVGASMFDNAPKRPSPQEAQQQVQATQDRAYQQMKRANELATNFLRLLEDKTLAQNKSVFAREMERDLLASMIQLGDEINNDPDQKSDSYGSLSWITLLFKTCLAQRDRLNQLDYVLSQLEKRTDPAVLADFINREITKALDKKKSGE